MEMEKERMIRYKDKLELIDERATDIRNWTEEMSEESIQGDKKTIFAVWKAFQELVEAAMDLCSMILKDSRKTVKDDYENIGKLEEIGIISTELGSVLRESNGLRNRLVHEYNGLEPKTALISIKELLPELIEFKKMVKKWIK